MQRAPSNTRRVSSRRARPAIEGLEDRRVMSADPFTVAALDAPVSVGAPPDAPVELYTTPTPSGVGAVSAELHIKPDSSGVGPVSVGAATTSVGATAVDGVRPISASISDDVRPISAPISDDVRLISAPISADVMPISAPATSGEASITRTPTALAPTDLRAVPAATAQTVSAAESNGVFSHNFQRFSYTTPEGTRVVLSIQGRGSMAGTFVDDNGALHLRYSKSNSYTKIVSNVHGGSGRALLASVYSLPQAEAGHQASLSGFGSPLIGMINLRRFDLIPGGTVNVEAGIGVLGLRSAAPNSQIQLRELPAPPPTQESTQPPLPGEEPPTSLTGGPEDRFITDLFLVQTLVGADGEFLSAGNILLETAPGEPGPPPAPPGVIVVIDQINGDTPAVPNLITDARIFGYDPVLGQVLRFQLNLEAETGVVDTAFAPIAVPGAPADAGVALGRVDQRIVLLVDDGASVSVYDATFGTALGSFTVPAGFTDIGSTDVLTVLANPSTNELRMIDVGASLAAGVATPPAGNPAPFTTAPGVELLGGITGLPGSSQIYTSIAAPFNTLTPLENQLGFLNVLTTGTTPDPTGGVFITNQFSTVQQQAFTPFVPIPAGNPDGTAAALGSIDRSLAVNGVGTDANGDPVPNTISLLGQVTLGGRGSVVLAHPNQLTDLSESFRPDLTGSVLIDVQGNIQSVRGSRAHNLVLNNAGNLNLVTFDTMTDSTIVGEPISHIRIKKRDNVSIFSTARVVGGRGDVTFVKNLQAIGPLSQTFNRPQP